jgi:hypothetical protein
MLKSVIVFRFASPKRGRTGYFCKLCLDYFRDTNPGEEFTKFFASRDGVWINDIFEPFLNWVNNDLANAKWLGLSGSRKRKGRKQCRSEA